MGEEKYMGDALKTIYSDKKLINKTVKIRTIIWSSVLCCIYFFCLDSADILGATLRMAALWACGMLFCRHPLRHLNDQLTFYQYGVRLNNIDIPFEHHSEIRFRYGKMFSGVDVKGRYFVWTRRIIKAFADRFSDRYDITYLAGAEAAFINTYMIVGR